MPAAVKIELLGDKELKDTLENFAPKEARNILRATVQALAKRVRDELRRNVKKRDRQLEKSIRHRRARGSVDEVVSEVRGGATAPYMFMLEYGTSRTSAQPFINPTVEQMRSQMPTFYKEDFFKKFTAAVAKKAAQVTPKGIK